MEAANNDTVTKDAEADGKIEANEVLQLVTFRLGNEEYSLDILSVQEIIRHMDLTRVPRTPDFVDGVINLRGRVIPVIDLRKRFGLTTEDKTNDTRIIVVDVNDANETVVGFKVDAVSEVLRLPSDRVEAPPSIVSDVNSDYIKGVGKIDGRLIILLDVERILSHKEMDALGAVGSAQSGDETQPESKDTADEDSVAV